ncbi:deiodinase-like protein [Mycobacterium spongiae]|uniref:Redoxin domain-containing protein n=1 Tax=Mycobacterium spongiae TaxID=886343 RepID=A0A975JXY7_9MYCO|nr:deiodinase-like protein [Mycobacterium spongiae]QUR67757.1 redoxin domain-containing protein [Mycobacterium spongiae]
MKNAASATRGQDLQSYNYPHFHVHPEQLEALGGVEVGDPAPDFAARRLDGTEVRLSDFRGRPVVLETGSVSCPQYVSRVTQMNALAYRFPDVVFLVLYVREAHPGGHISAHRTADDKNAAARIAVSEEREGRVILVDDVEGSAHHDYGCMPNTVHVIDAKGTVVFRALWNDPAGVEAALRSLSSGGDPAAVRTAFSPAPPTTLLRVLRRAGWRAVWDFALAFPQLAVGHLRESLPGRTRLTRLDR